MEIVDIRGNKEPDKCFKITYTTGDTELIHATSIGSTEELKEFITFYDEADRDMVLVCMINQYLIRKIETIATPKILIIKDGEKIFDEVV